MSAASAASAEAPLNRGMITLTVMIAAVLQTLDNTIANVALPTMQGTLSATQDQITWVLTSYIVAAAIMTPLSGWLCARYGRKEVFALSVAGFTLTSVLCGLAQTLPEAVLFRTLQGICGAALMPVSQSILLDINPPSKQARAMATWSFAAVFGPMIGPVLGGWLTDVYSWRWVFFINVPIGLLSLAGTLLFIPRLPGARVAFDMLGFSLLALAVGALQLMLDRGEFKDWFDSGEIIIEAIVCGLALYLFLVHSATTRAPFIRRELLRDRNFMVGLVVIFLMGVAIFSVMSLLPPLLQHLMNRSATTAGVVMGWRGLGSIAAVIVVGHYASRLSARWTILAGLVVTSISSWILVTISPQMDDRLIVWSSILQGIGSLPIFVMATSQAFATLPAALRSEAAALFSLMRNLGASVGIASLQAYFVRHAQILHARLGEHLLPFATAVSRPELAQKMISTHGLAELNAGLSAQAEWLSYISTFEVATLSTLVALPLVFLFRSKGPASADTTVGAAFAD